MFLLVHISDIHVKSELDVVLSRAPAIAAAVAANGSSATAVVIAITGDIAFSGLEYQYELAANLFSDIASRLRTELQLPVHIVMVPGNHDCDFSGRQELRNLVLTQLAAKPEACLSEEFLNVCTEPQERYFQFRKQLIGAHALGVDRIRQPHQIELDGQVVTFDCINLAWVSQLREDKVTFPASVLPPRKDAVGCVITLMHHPFNWLHPSAYREFRRRVRSRSDFVLSGHEHQWNVIETTESEAGECIQFEGDALFDSTSGNSGFAVLEVDLVESKYRASGYEWRDEAYRRRAISGWEGFRKFELTSPPDSWAFNARFRSEIDDVGVSLRVGGKDDVFLSDVFVFPDLEASTDESDGRESVTSETLRSGKSTKNGFVLQGDDRSGRSTLLKHLAVKYLEAGLVPVYCRGSAVSRATEDEIDKLLASLATEQYERKTAEDYTQLSRARKVVLLDDFDESPIKSEKARGQLLARLRKRCATLVISVSDVFEAAHLISAEGDEVYSALPKFRVLPFGRLSRARLISRWVMLDADEFLAEEERIRRIDEATRFVEMVMRRGVVPAYPIYLLALLQAVRTSSKDTFEDSGLGYYYQFLISDGLLEAGVKKDELAEVFQYCTQLSWAMKVADRTSLCEAEMRAFNDAFTRRWVALDFPVLRDRLVRARILLVSGDSVEFRYGYCYYFFVAKYLADNFDEPAVQQFVQESAAQLYVRSRANIMVFLTHFTNRPAVIDAIRSTLCAQFADMAVAQFSIRDESVESMLRQLPQIIYEGGDPLVHRERQARLEDATESSRSDGMSERAETGELLSLSARLTMVFKTVEILGQILKTQYARIERPRRREIILDLMSGPLRALESFYELLRAHPDAIVSEFESRLEEEAKDKTREVRRAVAQRVVGSLVLAVSFGFIRKIAEAVSAESIADDVKGVVFERDEVAYRLIGLAAELDAQKPLPRGTIEEIRRLGSGSLIVERLVQVLVVYHMYMYRTSFADIRWAEEVLDIPSRIKMKALLESGVGTLSSIPK